MAKKPTNQAASAGSGLARALIDLPAFGVSNGDLVAASDALLDSLESNGSIDRHPEAVEYARSIGATVREVSEQ